MSEWSRSQLYEERAAKRDDRAWRIPFSEQYWLNFMCLSSVPSGVSLEVGCGSHGLWRFNPSVIGFDPIDYSRFGVNFKQGKAESLPYPDLCFSDVYCVNSLDHMENPRAAMREMARVCSDRVVLWCYVFDSAMQPFFRAMYKPHPHAFTELQLMDLVPSGFEVTYNARVTPSKVLFEFSNSRAALFKLRVAEALGAHALLLHLRRKTR